MIMMGGRPVNKVAGRKAPSSDRLHQVRISAHGQVNGEPLCTQVGRGSVDRWIDGRPFLGFFASRVCDGKHLLCTVMLFAHSYYRSQIFTHPPLLRYPPDFE